MGSILTVHRELFSVDQNSKRRAVEKSAVDMNINLGLMGEREIRGL